MERGRNNTGSRAKRWAGSNFACMAVLRARIIPVHSVWYTGLGDWEMLPSQVLHPTAARNALRPSGNSRASLRWRETSLGEVT